MSLRLVQAQILWRHDGSEAISGMTTGPLVFRPSSSPATINGTIIAPASAAASDWMEIDLTDIDKLLIQTDVTIDDVGNLAGAATCNTRFACVGVPYYDQFIDEVPEPVGRTPADTNVSDPTREQVENISLSARPWQDDQAWTPSPDDAIVTYDAGLVINGTTPVNGLRQTAVAELGIFRPTAAVSGTGVQGISDRAFSVELLDRCWLAITQVNQFATTNWDGSERLKVSITALKYQDIARMDAPYYRGGAL